MVRPFLCVTADIVDATGDLHATFIDNGEIAKCMQYWGIIATQEVTQMEISLN